MIPPVAEEREASGRMRRGSTRTGSLDSLLQVGSRGGRNTVEMLVPQAKQHETSGKVK